MPAAEQPRGTRELGPPDVGPSMRGCHLKDPKDPEQENHADRHAKQPQ